MLTFAEAQDHGSVFDSEAQTEGSEAEERVLPTTPNSTKKQKKP